MYTVDEDGIYFYAQDKRPSPKNPGHHLTPASQLGQVGLV